MSQESSHPTVDAPYNWHGYLLADAGLPAPTCFVKSTDLSRPDCTKILSAEYLDSPDVLEVKAELLIKMWTAATHPLVYAGAGISTSSGVQDYASNAKGSTVQPQKRRLTMDFILNLKSTPAHRVITAMERRGLVWGWLQQNHDGLAQKAGFPANKVNELHGSWLDQEANPIIAMSGSLRGDLFEWMLAMEEGCDFVFGVGTSFSGLNADRCAKTCAKRHMKKKRQGQGLAILTIQQTQIDDLAALRIFSKIDDFMLIVARKLELAIDQKDYRYAPAALPVGVPNDDTWMSDRASRIAAGKAEVAAKKQKPTAAAAPSTTATSVPPTAPTVTLAAAAAAAAAGAATSTSKKVTTTSLQGQSQPVRLEIGNRHRTVESGNQNRHEWTMFVRQVDPSPHALISSVVFELHPTFTPRLVSVSQPTGGDAASGGKFELTRCGWGTFEVTAFIRLTTGETVKLAHELSFCDGVSARIVMVDATNSSNSFSASDKSTRGGAPTQSAIAAAAAV